MFILEIFINRQVGANPIPLIQIRVAQLKPTEPTPNQTLVSTASFIIIYSAAAKIPNFLYAEPG